jgi:murein DD-endopeptidase MepM/ murein hydrolase activator NlpD
MRRSPLNNFDLRVSVEKLETPSLWGNLQSTMSVAASRWSTAGVSGYVRRRATVHVSVLALAVAVAGGSAFVGRAPDNSPAFTQAAGGTDSLEVAARTAIIARSIPLTSSSGDSSYVVQPGDTLTSISRQTGVNEEALLAFNGYSSSDALNVGLRLRIPDLSKVPAEQLRIKDTAPHEATPLVNEAVLPPQKPAPELTIHEVQKGDTASKLAANAGVTEATVMASNNLQKTTVLALGQTLVIPAISGRLVATKPGDTVASLAQTYGSTAQGVIAANKLDQRTTVIAPDQLVLVPADPDAAIAIIKDIPTTTTEPRAQAKPVAPAEAAAPVKIPAAPRPASSPGFTWPAPGTITTYFSSWHNGIDVANSMGTPVRAAQAGRVVYSGWDNSGFGYMVRIDHGNGLQTLYGHASRLIAKVGDYVDQGQVIMLMGSTGRSTGPHVHFSVFQGSGYTGYNPLKYLP